MATVKNHDVLRTKKNKKLFRIVAYKTYDDAADDFRLQSLQTGVWSKRRWTWAELQALGVKKARRIRDAKKLSVA